MTKIEEMSSEMSHISSNNIGRLSGVGFVVEMIPNFKIMLVSLKINPSCQIPFILF